MTHLVIAPILLPLLTAAVMLALRERRHTLNAVINAVSAALGLAVAVALLLHVHASEAPAAMGVYLPGNWEAPFGIVLVVDRLSAMMLVLGATVGLAALLFALARWHRAGVNFHPLFQLQLMGLNGAFLTADLFNLFVFFEVLLVASYGLLLHGSGRTRVRAGLHYIAINLLASALFLVGVAMVYGVTGTLNMADIADKLPHVPDSDRGLLHAGATILGIAFLAKAAFWPLNFWLVPAYSAASAPVAAIFALLTKVGVYAVLRLWTLCFPSSAGGSALFGADVLVWGGLVTLAFGAIGCMASQQLGRLAAFSIIVSSGTVLAAIGFAQSALTGGALFYLVSSTMAAAALFLLVELVERARHAGYVEVDRPLADDGDDHLPFFVEPDARPGTNLDDDEQALIGRPIPAALAFLALAFLMSTLVIAGLPPLSGFIGKVAMLGALLNEADTARSVVPVAAWALFALLIGSSLLSAIALARVGIRHFWSPHEGAVPRLRVIEVLPVAALLLACVLLVVGAEPALAYTRASADALYQPTRYIDAVMSARPHSMPAPRTEAGR
jgi:multicomponent K+:H+ antiporter subunit D